MSYDAESQKLSVYTGNISFSFDVTRSESCNFIYTPGSNTTEAEADSRFQEIVDFFAAFDNDGISATKQNSTSESCTPTEPE